MDRPAAEQVPRRRAPRRAGARRRHRVHRRELPAHDRRGGQGPSSRGLVVLRGSPPAAAAARCRRRLRPRRDRPACHHLRGHAPGGMAGRGPLGRHGPELDRGVALLPDVPAFLRSDVQRGEGQGAGAALRPGLQRLDGRRLVRAVERSVDPADADSAVGRRSGCGRGPAQRRARGASRLLQRDPALSRPAVDPRRAQLLGPVLRGVRGGRRGHQHAHRVELEDAVDVSRRAPGGRLDADVRQRLLQPGRLAHVGCVHPLPGPHDRVQRRPDRLDPVCARAGRRGVAREPRLGRRGRQGEGATERAVPPARLRLLLRRRPRSPIDRRHRRRSHHLRE